MRWLELVWFAPLFVGIGCGGNVSFNTSAGGTGPGTSSSAGGNGGGGAGGANGGAGPTSSVSTGGSMGGTGGANGGAGPTSSVSTGGSMGGTGGTGGTGGGTACDQACMKAGSCGLPANQCQQFVNCGNAQGACLADCINDPNVTCQDLNDALQGKAGPLTTCLQGCQGGQVSTSTGSGGAGGGPSMQCQQCGQNSCANAFFQCVQSAGFMTCQSWQQCVGKCSDSACFDACNAMYPAAAPVAQCACTSCAMECSAVCGGSSVSSSVSVSSSAATTGAGGGGNAMQCQQCGQQQCSAEVQQCFGAGFNACQAWLNCTQPCMSKACVDDCSAKNPAGATLGVCICDKCAAGGCGYTCN